jgi:hypothetical protein
VARPGACEDPPVDIHPDGSPARQRAATVVVRELERHVAAAGWDGPIRLFALIRTADAVRRDAALASRLPPDVIEAARADPEHLTAIEQENLPAAGTPSQLLARIGWPTTVDGAAIVLERSVAPTDVEDELPDDEARAAELLADHPARQDVRMAAAVLRDGTGSCAVRSREHDQDALVAVGPTVVPALLEVLLATLDD